MNLLTEWVKPSGARVQLNDAESTVETAIELGWVRFSETPEGIKEAEEFLAAQVKKAEDTVKAAAKAEKTKKKDTA